MWLVSQHSYQQNITWTIADQDTYNIVKWCQKATFVLSCLSPALRWSVNSEIIFETHIHDYFFNVYREYFSLSITQKN